MRVVNSESGYLWFVVDEENQIVRVYLNKENAMSEIGV